MGLTVGAVLDTISRVRSEFQGYEAEKNFPFSKQVGKISEQVAQIVEKCDQDYHVLIDAAKGNQQQDISLIGNEAREMYGQWRRKARFWRVASLTSLCVTLGSMFGGIAHMAATNEISLLIPSVVGTGIFGLVFHVVEDSAQWAAKGRDSFHSQWSAADRWGKYLGEDQIHDEKAKVA